MTMMLGRGATPALSTAVAGALATAPSDRAAAKIRGARFIPNSSGRRTLAGSRVPICPIERRGAIAPRHGASASRTDPGNLPHGRVQRRGAQAADLPADAVQEHRAPRGPALAEAVR